MLRAVLNKSWRTAAVRLLITHHEMIKLRRTWYAGHCWRSKDELISDILLWTPSHRRAKVVQLARTYIQELFANTGYSLEDLSVAMDDWDGWWKRAREIHGGSVTWWWWWYIHVDRQRKREKQRLECCRYSVEGIIYLWCIYIYIYIYIYIPCVKKKNFLKRYTSFY